MTSEAIGRAGGLMPAAQYLRMSTEHQLYSTANQQAAIAAFAAANGFVVQRTYADEGRSGLTLQRRPGLARLLADVEQGQADFVALLVCDVSRWGRFQDADESAYYEFICRRSGIAVHFCAEPFQNDGSPLATIMKSVKRAMAGEFSRELSGKVRAGQRRLAALGHYQGSPVPFGFKRVLTAPDGSPKGELCAGERKNLQDDRVRLAPGDPDEVALVRAMFAQAARGASPAKIAEAANPFGARRRSGRWWSARDVRLILRDERYAGCYVFGRTETLLGGRRRARPRAEWVISRRAHPSIVPERQFGAVQRRLARPRWTRSDLIAGLERLLGEAGELSSVLITECPYLPSTWSIERCFGSLREAYAAVGYRRSGRGKHRRERSKRTWFVRKCLSDLSDAGVQVEDAPNGAFVLDGGLKVAFSVARPSPGPWGVWWLHRFRDDQDVDVRVAGRAVTEGDRVIDYLILPAGTTPPRVALRDPLQPRLRAFQARSLEPLLVLVAARACLPTT